MKSCASPRTTSQPPFTLPNGSILVRGGIGTLVLLWAMGRLRGSASWQPIWVGLSVVTLGIWAVAVILGIALPVMVTGTDPT